MITRKHLEMAVLLSLSFAWFQGCAAPSGRQDGAYLDAGEIGAMTVELDDHDYDLAADGIAKAMISGGLPSGYVVALGPVDTRDCKYSVQIGTIQKSLQVQFNRHGDLKFTSAVNAMAGSEAAQEIYKIIEYNWANRNPVDTEYMQKFGKLAHVNGILFGRVSALERKTPKGREITYRFVWELSNTQTGILDVSHEKKIRKLIY